MLVLICFCPFNAFAYTNLSEQSGAVHIHTLPVDARGSVDGAVFLTHLLRIGGVALLLFFLKVLGGAVSFLSVAIGSRHFASSLSSASLVQRALNLRFATAA